MFRASHSVGPEPLLSSLCDWTTGCLRRNPPSLRRSPVHVR